MYAAGSARGLSPRVRGNRGGRGSDGEYRGSIPACAGEPNSVSAFMKARRVYPRVCGGTDVQCAVGALPDGLSPRVRGNRRSVQRGRCRLGSIPACAGEPAPTSSLGDPIQVYPRVCGGTASSPIAPAPVPGLSPRVRGNPPAASSASAVMGSIPACAGEPVGIAMPTSMMRVYPRVCGGTRPTPTD